MAVALSSSLLAHQSGTRRLPAISVVASARRSGIDVLRWERRYAGVEPDMPFAAAVTAAGTLLRVRNASGSLDVARTVSPAGEAAVFDSWVTLGSVTAGAPVAVVSHGGETLLFSCSSSGKTIEVRTSADDGATWSAASGIVTETSAIGSLAAAIAPGGDVCVFYVAGTTTSLKRLRRTGGTWAGSGTVWTKASFVASLTRIAACHDGADYVLVITGSDADGAPGAWTVRMGDGGLPVNAWSALTSLADADVDSTVTFESPSILARGGDFHGAVTRVEAGHVPAKATLTMHSLHLAGSSSVWTEPVPLRDATGGGLAFAGADASNAWAASVSEVFSAALDWQSDLTGALLSLDWVLGDGRSQARFEFDGAMSRGGDVPRPGDSLTAHHGYRSGAAGVAEYGLVLEFVVATVTARTDGGRSRLEVAADGPWEALERWRAPDSWQASAADFTRETSFARLAAKAGVSAASLPSPVAPPAEWIDTGMALALAPRESAAVALRQLMTGLDVAALHTGAALAVRSLAADESPVWDVGGPGEHPFREFNAEQTRGPGWLRLLGDGRYADAFDTSAETAAGLIRDMSASSDGVAGAHAASAFRHERLSRPQAFAVLPFHAGIELWDVVTVTHPPGGAASNMRVVEAALRYRRGDRGGRYDTLLTLGEV